MLPQMGRKRDAGIASPRLGPAPGLAVNSVGRGILA
jgi:hypothetical protein